MGKFINTQYKETIDDLTLSSKDFLNNPFYKFNDKRPTRVKYWNTNLEESTLDEGSGLQMDEVGKESPTRFNLIEDLFLYGLPRMELNLENGDFGYEAEPITGECYIQPNTIVPVQGDFFQIDYMFDGPWLFIVTGVDKDTFEHGANAYKITYRLEFHEDQSIKDNVVDEFVAIEQQEGTNYNTIIQKKKYFDAVRLDDLAVTLKEYYISLFFRENVQTFIYQWENWSNMYDPFMVEFIIRNGILQNNSSKYVHVEHVMPLPNTFSVDYDRSVYRAFELKSIDKLASSVYVSQADMETSMVSPFYSVFEDYWYLTYQPIIGIEQGKYNARDYIEIVPEDLVYAIRENREITNQRFAYQNIFVKFFNGKDIKESDLKLIEAIPFESSKELFYMTPFLIFVLEYYTKKALS